MATAITMQLTAADDTTSGKKSTLHLRNGEIVEGVITGRNDQQVEIIFHERD